MVELHLADEILARIRARGGQYHERAYLFVLAAIEYFQCRLDRRRHVSGQELALACRDLALEQYGLTAGLVLHHWGVTTTRDWGTIVFALVDVDLLTTPPCDSEEDCDSVYDFDDAFGAEYVWQGVPGRATNEESIRLEER